MFQIFYFQSPFFLHFFNNDPSKHRIFKHDYSANSFWTVFTQWSFNQRDSCNFRKWGKYLSHSIEEFFLIVFRTAVEATKSL